MRESAPCVTTTSFSTMRSARRRPPASTATCSIIRSSICAVPLTALSSDVKISGSVTSVRKPRLPKLTPRMGMSESGFRDAAGRAEQRAVAAEHDDHVDMAREARRCRRRSNCAVGARRPGQRRGVRIEDRRQVPLFEPRRDLREVARGALEPCFRHDADRGASEPRGSVADAGRTRGCRCRR